MFLCKSNHQEKPISAEHELLMLAKREIDPLSDPLGIHVSQRIGDLALPHAWSRRNTSGGSTSGESGKRGKGKLPRKSTEEQAHDAKNKATGKGKYDETNFRRKSNPRGIN